MTSKIIFLLCFLVAPSSSCLWKNNHLTWHLVDESNVVDSEILNVAFNFWAKDTDFEFEQEVNTADIHIVTKPLVNKTAVTRNQEIYLNEDTNWTRELLFSVMIHEIGHVLGLEALNDTNSVMYHQPRPYNYTLQTVDQEALKAIYSGGKPCTARYNAVALIDSTFYVFNMENYKTLNLNNGSISTGHMSDLFPYSRFGQIDAYFKLTSDVVAVISQNIMYTSDDRTIDLLDILNTKLKVRAAVTVKERTYLFASSGWVFVTGKGIFGYESKPVTQVFSPMTYYDIIGAYTMMDRYIIIVSNGREWIYDDNWQFLGSQALIDAYPLMFCENVCLDAYSLSLSPPITFSSVLAIVLHLAIFFKYHIQLN